jgi:heme exporter protein D
MNNLKNFFYMGGYAYYVWSAYTALFFIFILQWIIPWKKWSKYQKKIKIKIIKDES